MEHQVQDSKPTIKLPRRVPVPTWTILYKIQQKYPVEAVITVMTLTDPSKPSTIYDDYFGQLKKVVHRSSTEYIPIDREEALTPLPIDPNEPEEPYVPLEHCIEDGVLQLYFQV